MGKNQNQNTSLPNAEKTVEQIPSFCTIQIRMKRTSSVFFKYLINVLHFVFVDISTDGRNMQLKLLIYITGKN